MHVIWNNSDLAYVHSSFNNSLVKLCCLCSYYYHQQLYLAALQYHYRVVTGDQRTSYAEKFNTHKSYNIIYSLLLQLATFS